MSDGDSPWLDEAGAPTSARSRDHCVAPGEAIALPVREELSFVVLTDANGGAGVAPFLLGNEALVPLRVRVYASAVFPFSPRHEFVLAPGESRSLTHTRAGTSVRVR